MRPSEENAPDLIENESEEASLFVDGEDTSNTQLIDCLFYMLLFFCTPTE